MGLPQDLCAEGSIPKKGSMARASLALAVCFNRERNPKILYLELRKPTERDRQNMAEQLEDNKLLMALTEGGLFGIGPNCSWKATIQTLKL